MIIGRKRKIKGSPGGGVAFLFAVYFENIHQHSNIIISLYAYRDLINLALVLTWLLHMSNNTETNDRRQCRLGIRQSPAKTTIQVQEIEKIKD